MRTAATLLLFLSLLLTAQAGAAAAGGDWPAFRGGPFRDAVQDRSGGTDLAHYGVARHLAVKAEGARAGYLFPGITVANVTGGAGLETLLANYNVLLAVAADGSLQWDRALPVTEVGMTTVGDATGDGSPEVAFLTTKPSRLYVLDGRDGATVAKVDFPEVEPPAPPVLWDLDGRRGLEIVYAFDGNVVRAARLAPPSQGGGLLPPPEEPRWRLEDLWAVTLPEDWHAMEVLLGDLSESHEGPEVVASGFFVEDNDLRGWIAAITLEGRELWRVTTDRGARVKNVGDFHPGRAGAELFVRLTGNDFKEFRLYDGAGEPLCKLGEQGDLRDSAVATDLDGDGAQELVVTDWSRDAVVAWSGCATAWMARPGSEEGWALGGHPVGADLDGDGALELVGATNEGTVFMLNGAGALLRAVALHPPPSGGHRQTAVADVDQDGDLEVVVTYLDGDAYVVAGLPDLAPEGATVAGDRVTFNVRAAGESPPAEVVVRALSAPPGTEGAREEATRVRPGQVASLPFFKGGTWIELDPSNNVREFNEANNVLAVTGPLEAPFGAGGAGALACIVAAAAAARPRARGGGGRGPTEYDGRS